MAIGLLACICGIAVNDPSSIQASRDVAASLNNHILGKCHCRPHGKAPSDLPSGPSNNAARRYRLKRRRRSRPA